VKAEVGGDKGMMKGGEVMGGKSRKIGREEDRGTGGGEGKGLGGGGKKRGGEVEGAEG